MLQNKFNDVMKLSPPSKVLVTAFSDLLVCCIKSSWIQKSIWAKLCYFEANHCKTQPKKFTIFLPTFQNPTVIWENVWCNTQSVKGRMAIPIVQIINTVFRYKTASHVIGTFCRDLRIPLTFLVTTHWARSKTRHGGFSENPANYNDN